MKIDICRLEKKLSVILPLAEAYQRSYNQLSSGYKSDAEMALYKRGYFLKKLWKIAEDTQSVAAVLKIDDVPRGFVRYSKIPDYYTRVTDGTAYETESGILDGYQFAWRRKIYFDQDIQLNKHSLIVNQIYLDPQIQRCGLGTLLLEKTIPALKKQGYNNLIIEYNANNANAEKFYKTLGFSAFARTKDFDHIVQDENGRASLCISDVKIAHTTIDNIMAHIDDRHRRKQAVVAITFNRSAKDGKSY